MQPQPLHESISKRLAAGREIVSAIRIAAHSNFTVQSFELLALARRIELCCDPANMFVAKNAYNPETGDSYTAKGNHWKCGSKLCPNCISDFARRHRFRLRQQINRVQLTAKERWHFGTMTIPNPKLSLVATRELVNYAWSLYRKRLLSVSLIRGGAKSEEFTLTTTGYHYHLHTLYIAPWHSFQEVRRVWTECVEAAFAQANIPFAVNNKDGLLSVTIKRVTNIDQVAHEVCKYITKSDSWTKMPTEHLREVGLVRRWWRMFELFGCMRAEATSKVDTTTQDRVDETILDTRSLSDGASPSHSETWRLKQAKMSLEAYYDFVTDQFLATIHFRREQIKRRWPQCILFDAQELGIK